MIKKQDKKFKRKCVICSQYKEKCDLIRFTKDKNTEKIILNKENKVNGRSFYICNNKECLNEALKNKVLSKYTKLNTCPNITKEIENILNSENF